MHDDFATEREHFRTGRKLNFFGKDGLSNVQARHTDVQVVGDV